MTGHRDAALGCRVKVEGCGVASDPLEVLVYKTQVGSATYLCVAEPACNHDCAVDEL